MWGGGGKVQPADVVDLEENKQQSTPHQHEKQNPPLSQAPTETSCPRVPGSTQANPSLDELNQSVRVPQGDASWHSKAWAFFGMGALIAVGYMDPGNWASDIQGGAHFGYTLLSVILVSSALAMFLQYLSLKLGAASDLDLAQACRASLHPVPNFILWLLTEVAIAATDLVGIAGCATALHLLFGLPVWAGVLITALDVLLLLLLLGHSISLLELTTFVLAIFITGSLIYQLVLANPNWGDVASGFVPHGDIFKGALFSAMAILGATVMPHNLYLHSSLVQTRGYPRTPEGRQMAVRYATWDSILALSVAFFVNCAILILAAAAFYYGPGAVSGVADITDAYRLISTALGQDAARIVFGVALFAAGQSSSISGTLAGQVVMEGFIELKMQPWARRLLTRMVAIVPAVIVAVISGPHGMGRLLVLSQVVLSVQLPFAVGPLVYFTTSKSIMGGLVTGALVSILAWGVFLVLTGLSMCLVVQSIMGVTG